MGSKNFIGTHQGKHDLIIWGADRIASEPAFAYRKGGTEKPLPISRRRDTKARKRVRFLDSNAREGTSCIAYRRKLRGGSSAPDKWGRQCHDGGGKVTPSNPRLRRSNYLAPAEVYWEPEVHLRGCAAPTMRCFES